MDKDIFQYNVSILTSVRFIDTSFHIYQEGLSAPLPAENCPDNFGECAWAF